MKKVLNHFLFGVGVMIVLTFMLGLLDDAFRKTGIWYKDIVGSLRYYVLWVVPYWWMIILIGGVVVGLISYGVTAAIKAMSKRENS